MEDNSKQEVTLNGRCECGYMISECCCRATERFTKEEIYQKHYDEYVDNMMEIGYSPHAAIMKAMDEWASLVSAEKDKEIELLKKDKSTFFARALDEATAKIKELEFYGMEKRAEIEELENENNQYLDDTESLQNELVYARHQADELKQRLSEVEEKADKLAEAFKSILETVNTSLGEFYINDAQTVRKIAKEALAAYQSGKENKD